jgi:hypothetical protein
MTLNIIGIWKFIDETWIEYIIVREDGYGEYIMIDDGELLYRNKIYSNVSYIDVDRFQLEYSLIIDKLHIGNKVYHKVEKITEDLDENR